MPEITAEKKLHNPQADKPQPVLQLYALGLGFDEFHWQRLDVAALKLALCPDPAHYTPPETIPSSRFAPEPNLLKPATILNQKGLQNQWTNIRGLRTLQQIFKTNQDHNLWHSSKPLPPIYPVVLYIYGPRFMTGVNNISTGGDSPPIRPRILPNDIMALDLAELFFFLYPEKFVSPNEAGFQKTFGLSPDLKPTEIIQAVFTEMLKAFVELLSQTNLKPDDAKNYSKRQILLTLMLQQKNFEILGDMIVILRPDLKNIIKPILPIIQTADSEKIANQQQLNHYWVILFELLQLLPKYERIEKSGSHATMPLTAIEISNRLEQLRRTMGDLAENRKGQENYAHYLLPAFQGRTLANQPNMVLAEGETGTGKTLGYLAAATLFAEKNHTPVWVSTFTRYLQHQISDEMARLYPDTKTHQQKVVIRKGRENYLCILNLEDSLNRGKLDEREGYAALLMLNWLFQTETGDLFGSDLPAWVTEFLPKNYLYLLRDKNGECMNAACQHYKTCKIEQVAEHSKKADIVITNHHLLLLLASSYQLRGKQWAKRLVVDEGHHLPRAADSVFSTRLTLTTLADLKRWLIGDDRKRGLRGLQKRLKYLALPSSLIAKAANLTRLAEHLPNFTEVKWLQSGQFIEKVKGQHSLSLDWLIEIFELMQSYKKSQKSASYLPGMVEEMPITITSPLLLELSDNLLRLFEKILALVQELLNELEQFNLNQKKLATTETMASSPPQHHHAYEKIMNNNPVQNLQTTEINLTEKLESLSHALTARVLQPVTAFQQLLQQLLAQKQTELNLDATGFSWFEYSPNEDIGLCRHFIDPMLPFSQLLFPLVDGMIITSASLSNPLTPKTQINQPTALPTMAPKTSSTQLTNWWDLPKRIFGVQHLPQPEQAIFNLTASPFNYADMLKVFVITDLPAIITKKQQEIDSFTLVKPIHALAHAMAELFIASGGGAIGLFTAIHRLKICQPLIAADLKRAKLKLYSQHVDAMNLTTLIDLFRMEDNSCLLGTDALRDGVDVKGDSLRLMVFEKMPWAKPTLLQSTRHHVFKQENPEIDYKDYIAAMHIKQAVGRLIRSKTDRGVFVMADKRFPSRFINALPNGVKVEKLSLQEIVKKVREFFANDKIS